MKRSASSGRYRGYPSVRCTARSSARQPGSSASAFGRMRIGTSLAPGVPLKDPLVTHHDSTTRATDLLGWPSLVGLAARRLSRPLGKHDMCVAENALVEASVRIRVRFDVDVDAQGAGAPCDGC